MPHFFTAIGSFLMGSFFGFVMPKMLSRHSSQCTVTQQAQIIDSERTRVRSDDNDGYTNFYHPVFSYEYQGKRYSTRSSQSVFFKPRIGSYKKIKIDPNNPIHITFETSTEKLFKITRFFIILVGIISLFK